MSTVKLDEWKSTLFYLGDASAAAYQPDESIELSTAVADKTQTNSVATARPSKEEINEQKEMQALLKQFSAEQSLAQYPAPESNPLISPPKTSANGKAVYNPGWRDGVAPNPSVYKVLLRNAVLATATEKEKQTLGENPEPLVAKTWNLPPLRQSFDMAGVEKMLKPQQPIVPVPSEGVTITIDLDSVVAKPPPKSPPIRLPSPVNRAEKENILSADFRIKSASPSPTRPAVVSAAVEEVEEVAVTFKTDDVIEEVGFSQPADSVKSVNDEIEDLDAPLIDEEEDFVEEEEPEQLPEDIAPPTITPPVSPEEDDFVEEDEEDNEPVPTNVEISVPTVKVSPPVLEAKSIPLNAKSTLPKLASAKLSLPSMGLKIPTLNLSVPLPAADMNKRPSLSEIMEESDSKRQKTQSEINFEEEQSKLNAALARREKSALKPSPTVQKKTIFGTEEKEGEEEEEHDSDVPNDSFETSDEDSGPGDEEPSDAEDLDFAEERSNDEDDEGSYVEEELEEDEPVNVPEPQLKQGQGKKREVPQPPGSRKRQKRKRFEGEFAQMFEEADAQEEKRKGKGRKQKEPKPAKPLIVAATEKNKPLSKFVGHSSIEVGNQMRKEEKEKSKQLSEMASYRFSSSVKEIPITSLALVVSETIKKHYQLYQEFKLAWRDMLLVATSISFSEERKSKPEAALSLDQKMLKLLKPILKNRLAMNYSDWRRAHTHLSYWLWAYNSMVTYKDANEGSGGLRRIVFSRPMRSVTDVPETCSVFGRNAELPSILGIRFTARPSEWCFQEASLLVKELRSKHSLDSVKAVMTFANTMAVNDNFVQWINFTILSGLDPLNICSTNIWN